MEEEFFILLIFLAFVLLTIKMILGYLKGKQEHASAAEGSSLRASELRALIREAVAEANEPVEARLALLERRLEALHREELAALPPAEPRKSLHEAPARTEP